MHAMMNKIQIIMRIIHLIFNNENATIIEISLIKFCDTIDKKNQVNA